MFNLLEQLLNIFIVDDPSRKKQLHYSVSMWKCASAHLLRGHPGCTLRSRPRPNMLTDDNGEDKQHNITSEYHLMARVIVCSCGSELSLSNSHVLQYWGRFWLTSHTFGSEKHLPLCIQSARAPRSVRDVCLRWKCHHRYVEPVIQPVQLICSLSFKNICPIAPKINISI